MMIIKQIKNQRIRYNFKMCIYIYALYHKSDKKYMLLNKIVNQNLSIDINTARKYLLARSLNLTHKRCVDHLYNLGMNIFKIKGHKNFVKYIQKMQKIYNDYRIPLYAMVNKDAIDTAVNILCKSEKFNSNLVPLEIRKQFSKFMQDILLMYEKETI